MVKTLLVAAIAVGVLSTSASAGQFVDAAAAVLIAKRNCPAGLYTLDETDQIIALAGEIEGLSPAETTAAVALRAVSAEMAIQSTGGVPQFCAEAKKARDQSRS